MLIVSSSYWKNESLNYFRNPFSTVVANRNNFFSTEQVQGLSLSELVAQIQQNQLFLNAAYQGEELLFNQNALLSRLNSDLRAMLLRLSNKEEADASTAVQLLQLLIDMKLSRTNLISGSFDFEILPLIENIALIQNFQSHPQILAYLLILSLCENFLQLEELQQIMVSEEDQMNQNYYIYQRGCTVLIKFLQNDHQKYGILENFALDYNLENAQFLYQISIAALSVNSKDSAAPYQPQIDKWSPVLNQFQPETGQLNQAGEDNGPKAQPGAKQTIRLVDLERIHTLVLLISQAATDSIQSNENGNIAEFKEKIVSLLNTVSTTESDKRALITLARCQCQLKSPTSQLYQKIALFTSLNSALECEGFQTFQKMITLQQENMLFGAEDESNPIDEWLIQWIYTLNGGVQAIVKEAIGNINSENRVQQLHVAYQLMNCLRLCKHHYCSKETDNQEEMKEIKKQTAQLYLQIAALNGEFLLPRAGACQLVWDVYFKNKDQYEPLPTEIDTSTLFGPMLFNFKNQERFVGWFNESDDLVQQTFLKLRQQLFQIIERRDTSNVLQEAARKINFILSLTNIKQFQDQNLCSHTFDEIAAKNEDDDFISDLLQCDQCNIYKEIELKKCNTCSFIICNQCHIDLNQFVEWEQLYDGIDNFEIDPLFRIEDALNAEELPVQKVPIDFISKLADQARMNLLEGQSCTLDEISRYQCDLYDFELEKKILKKLSLAQKLSKNIQEPNLVKQYARGVACLSTSFFLAQQHQKPNSQLLNVAIDILEKLFTKSWDLRLLCQRPVKRTVSLRTYILFESVEVFYWAQLIVFRQKQLAEVYSIEQKDDQDCLKQIEDVRNLIRRLNLVYSQSLYNLPEKCHEIFFHILLALYQLNTFPEEASHFFPNRSVKLYLRDFQKVTRFLHEALDNIDLSQLQQHTQKKQEKLFQRLQRFKQERKWEDNFEVLQSFLLDLYNSNVRRFKLAFVSKHLFQAHPELQHLRDPFVREYTGSNQELYVKTILKAVEKLNLDPKLQALFIQPFLKVLKGSVSDVQILQHFIKIQGLTVEFKHKLVELVETKSQNAIQLTKQLVFQNLKNLCPEQALDQLYDLGHQIDKLQSIEIVQSRLKCAFALPELLKALRLTVVNSAKDYLKHEKLVQQYVKLAAAASEKSQRDALFSVVNSYQNQLLRNVLLQAKSIEMLLADATKHSLMDIYYSISKTLQIYADNCIPPQGKPSLYQRNLFQREQEVHFLLQSITLIAFAVYYDQQLLENEEQQIENIIFDLLGKRILLTPSLDFQLPVRILLVRLIELNTSEALLAEGLSIAKTFYEQQKLYTDIFQAPQYRNEASVPIEVQSELSKCFGRCISSQPGKRAEGTQQPLVSVRVKQIFQRLAQQFFDSQQAELGESATALPCLLDMHLTANLMRSVIALFPRLGPVLLATRVSGPSNSQVSGKQILPYNIEQPVTKHVHDGVDGRPLYLASLYAENYCWCDQDRTGYFFPFRFGYCEEESSSATDALLHGKHSCYARASSAMLFGQLHNEHHFRQMQNSLTNTVLSDIDIQELYMSWIEAQFMRNNIGTKSFTLDEQLHYQQLQLLKLDQSLQKLFIRICGGSTAAVGDEQLDQLTRFGVKLDVAKIFNEITSVIKRNLQKTKERSLPILDRDTSTLRLQKNRRIYFQFYYQNHFLRLLKQQKMEGFRERQFAKAHHGFMTYEELLQLYDRGLQRYLATEAENNSKREQKPLYLNFAAIAAVENAICWEQRDTADDYPTQSDKLGDKCFYQVHMSYLKHNKKLEFGQKKMISYPFYKLFSQQHQQKSETKDIAPTVNQKDATHILSVPRLLFDQLCINQSDYTKIVEHQTQFQDALDLRITKTSKTPETPSRNKAEREVSRNLRERMLDTAYELKPSEIKKLALLEKIERYTLQAHEESSADSCLVGELSLRASKFVFSPVDEQKIKQLLAELSDQERQEILRRLPQHSPLLHLASEEDRNAVRLWRQTNLPPLLEDVDLLELENKKDSLYLDYDDDDDNDDGDEDGGKDSESDYDIQDDEQNDKSKAYDQKKILFNDCNWDRELHTFYTSNGLEVLQSMPTVSDETLSMLIILCLCQSGLNEKHAQLLKRLCYSAQNCYAIYDTLTFILQLERSEWEFLYKQKHILGALYARLSKLKPENLEGAQDTIENQATREAAFERFLKAIIKPIFIDYNLFQKLYFKQGNYLSEHGVFSKLESTRLSARKHTLNLQQLSQEPGTALPMIINARKLISEKQTSQNIKLGEPSVASESGKTADQQKYSLLGVLAQACVRCKYQFSEQLESILLDGFMKCWSIYKRPFKKNFKLVRLKSQILVSDSLQLDLNAARELLQNKQNREKLEHSSAKGAKVDAGILTEFSVKQKPLWPHVDALRVCHNNAIVFEGLIRSILVTGQDRLLKFMRIVIDEQPELYFDAISAALDVVDAQMVWHANNIGQVLQKLKTDYAQNHPKDQYDPSKSLFVQDETAWRDQINTLLKVKAKSSNLFLQECAKSVRMAARLICAQLPSVLQKVILACDYNAPFKAELRQIRTSLETPQKKAELITALNLRKRISNFQCRENIKRHVLALVDSRTHALEYFRLFIEYIANFTEFFGIFGDDANTIYEVMKGYQPFFVALFKFGKTFSLVGRSHQDMTGTQKYIDHENFDSEWFDAENQIESQNEQNMSPIRLTRMLTNDPELAQLNTTTAVFLQQQHSNISRLQSQRSVLKTSFNSTPSALATIFESLFKKAYGWCKHGAAFIKNEHGEQFQKMALYKGGLVLMSEKLEVLKTIVQNYAQKLQPQIQEQDKTIEISRAKPWISTLTSYLEALTPAQIAMYTPRVRFPPESGQDQDGLTREWLTLLQLDVFNPSYGLFKLSSNNHSIYPSPLSFMVPNYLYHFRMLGRLVAKALVENWQFEVTFTKSFLKQIVGRPLSIPDLEDIDPELTKTLLQTLELDVTGLGLSYHQIFKVFDRPKNIALIENADDIIIDNTNKKDYVKALAKANMVDHTYRQIEAFRLGMHEIIPQQVLKLFSDNEIGLHLSGMPKVEVDDLQRHVIYSGCLKKDSETVKYLFEILHEWDQTMLANFLFFFSGSFKVPMEGFERYPLTIDGKTDTSRLPVAHTCFNWIELPNYADKTVLKEKLEFAILQGGGFQIL